MRAQLRRRAMKSVTTAHRPNTNAIRTQTDHRGTSGDSGFPYSGRDARKPSSKEIHSIRTAQVTRVGRLSFGWLATSMRSNVESSENVPPILAVTFCGCTSTSFKSSRYQRKGDERGAIGDAKWDKVLSVLGKGVWRRTIGKKS